MVERVGAGQLDVTPGLGPMQRWNHCKSHAHRYYLLKFYNLIVTLDPMKHRFIGSWDLLQYSISFPIDKLHTDRKGGGGLMRLH